MIVLTLIYEVFGSIRHQLWLHIRFWIFTAELLVFFVHRASFVRIIGNVRNTCARSTPSTIQRPRKITRNNSRRKPIWSKSKHVQHYMASVVQAEVIGSAYNETVLSPL